MAGKKVDAPGLSDALVGDSLGAAILALGFNRRWSSIKSSFGKGCATAHVFELPSTAMYWGLPTGCLCLWSKQAEAVHSQSRLHAGVAPRYILTFIRTLPYRMYGRGHTKANISHRAAALLQIERCHETALRRWVGCATRFEQRRCLSVGV